MRTAPALLLLLSVALLAGCDRFPKSRSLLVGGWAPPGETCDSRGGGVYDKQGVGAGYDGSGRWTLEARHLTTRVPDRGGFDRPGRKVSGEKPATAPILSLS